MSDMCKVRRPGCCCACTDEETTRLNTLADSTWVACFFFFLAQDESGKLTNDYWSKLQSRLKIDDDEDGLEGSNRCGH